MANSGAYWVARVLTSEPYCTKGVIELTTYGRMRTEMAMTARMIQPQTARPVAVSAGFLFSTVSVKLAIHGAYAIARNTAMRLMIQTKV